MLNILTIHAMRKTSALPMNLKTLLLSPAAAAAAAAATVVTGYLVSTK